MLGFGQSIGGGLRSRGVDDVDQLILRAEVVVQEPEVHSRVLGDVAQRDVRAPLRHQLAR
jgi:hypothetical protein